MVKRPRRITSDRGMAMAALLVMLSVMAVALTMLMPAWQTMVRREREAELVFRGEQYAKAVARFQRVRGAFPPNVDVLVTEKFLRKKYKDPMTENGEFQVIVVGQPIPGGAVPPAAAGRGGGAAQPGGGRGVQPGLAPGTPAPQSGFTPVTRGATGVNAGPILGVVSRSTGTSLRLYNGRSRYDEWAFVAAEATTAAGGGARGTQNPGGRGRTPNPGGRGGTPTPGPRGLGSGAEGGRGGFGGGGGGFGGAGGRGLQLPPRGGDRN